MLSINFIYHKKKAFSILFCLLCCITAILIGHFYTIEGSGISPDSTGYISAGENFHQGKGLIIGYGETKYQFTVWPPLYPFLISLLMHFGLSAEESARTIPILSYGILMFPVFYLGREIESVLTGIISCFFCLFSFTLIRITSYAWTEMPYVVFSAFSLYFLLLYWNSEKEEIKYLTLSCFFIILSNLSRYFGILLIIIGILIIFLKNSSTIKKKVFHILFFGILSGFPLGFWILRNFFLQVPASGAERWGSNTNFVDNSILLLYGILDDFFPLFIRAIKHYLDIYSTELSIELITPLDYYQLISNYFPSIQYIYISPLLFLLLLAFIVIKFDETFWNIIILLKQRGHFLIISYISLYLGTLLILSTIWYFDYINWRLTSPVVPLIIIICVSLTLNIRKLMIKIQSQKLYSIIVIGLLVIFIFGQIITDVFYYDEMSGGQDYNSHYWRDNNGIKYIIENVDDSIPIYSNDYYASRFYLKRTTPPLPFKNDEKGINHFIDICQKRNVIIIIYFIETATTRNSLTIDDLNILNNKNIILKQMKYYPDAIIFYSVPKNYEES